MSEQFNPDQEGMSAHAAEAIRADLEQIERGDFTWDQVATDLDYQDAGNTLEPRNSAFITELADKIKVESEPGMTIQGTDEWIPGKTTYSYEYTTADGSQVREEVPATLATRVKAHANQQKAAEAAEKAAADYAVKAAAHEDKKISIKDLAGLSVSELSKLSGLSQAEIHKLGKTGALDAINAQIVAKEVVKADKAAEEERLRLAEVERVRQERSEAHAAASKAAHEAAWAKNAEYAAQAEAAAAAAANDEKVANMRVQDAMKLSVSELSDLTGVPQSEIHKNGKLSVIEAAQKRIDERAAAQAEAATFVVPENTAAQARASELGALLKAHDRKLGQKAAGFAAPEGEPLSTNLPRPSGTPVSRELPNPTPVSGPRLGELNNVPWVDTDTPNGPVDVVIVPANADDASGTFAAPRAEDAVQLDSDYFADQIDQPTGRMSRWNRIKSVLFNVTPAVALSNFNARRQERGDQPRRGRVLLGIGAVAAAAAGTAIAWRAGAFDHAWDNINNLWEGPKPKGGTGAGNGSLEQAGDILGGGAPKSDKVERAADILTGDANLDQATPSAEAIDQLNQSIVDRTNEIGGATGSTPWSRAQEMYGNDATPRLIEAVSDLQAQGVDAQWVGDPLTSTDAYITINGSSDTSVVWNDLSRVMAQQDVENFLNAAKTAKPTIGTTLPSAL
jgi:hypothetical protein